MGSSADGLTFSAARGELFALVGPSGCGKTTTLRIIGGFIVPDSGTVLIDGIDMTRRPPYARPTNTVFQSYALFPHMSVGANIAFGLAMEGVALRERRTRVGEALELVGLQGFERRRVSELSGGQQQRAALARALVKKPTLLLLDEPMGSLDAQLRKQMQDELVRVKTSLGTTFIHVTHDQEEACAIADRIGVMKDGQLVQVDSPLALYRNPRDTYVASFLDVGNIVRGRNKRYGNLIEIAAEEIGVKARVPHTCAAGPVAAVIPADKVQIGPIDGRSDDMQASGRVDRIVFTKQNYTIYVRVGSHQEIKACLATDDVAALGSILQVGSPVSLRWDLGDVIVVAESQDATADRPEVNGSGSDRHLLRSWPNHRGRPGPDTQQAGQVPRWWPRALAHPRSRRFRSEGTR